ncbi:MAG: mechanosensitive ion channel [Acidobacteriota bacterium]|nr:mechanosensitive ion channel [Acidobacteriota bacterium]
MDWPNWTTTLEIVSGRVAEMLPTLLAVIGLIILGWVAARICRAVAGKVLAKAVDRLQDRLTKRGFLRASGLLLASPAVISRILYWAILLFFLAAALEKLQLPIVTNLLQNMAYFLPKVMLAVAVLFIGAGAGSLAHHWISDIAVRVGIEHAQVLGRMAQASIVALAVIVGIQQVGLEGRLFIAMATVTLGSTLGGMALAFALGAGPVVTNIMASYYASKTLSAGDTVRIAGIEGTVREITSTSIVIDAAEDRVYLPARKYCDEVSVLIGANR